MTPWSEIIGKYTSFFEERGHQRIPNASLVPENDPTTLFTSSGMQPLVPYLLGEAHPQGRRLVNVQNCFRAQDIDEVGDNRHTTFFRMLGNWSLGDYFKEDQLHWFWKFLTEELGLPKERLYVSIFDGYQGVPKDADSHKIWKGIGLQEDHLSFYGVDKNWWSRAGTPEQMPVGEIGGPDSEVFYDFGAHIHDHRYETKKGYDPNCDCGRFLEIGNSVFMQYQKDKGGPFRQLPQKNVDFGGGLERMLAAVENQPDIFQTSLLAPIIKSIEKVTGKTYEGYQQQMRIITDHLVAAVFIVRSGVVPSNKEQGYILRRLIRRVFDSLNTIKDIGNMTLPIRDITESIITQYKDTDPLLENNFENIVNQILKEFNNYQFVLTKAQKFIQKKYQRTGDELMGVTKISADDAFTLYATHGLSPTQIKSLGYTFDDQAFAKMMEEHQKVSRKGALRRFAGGLADHKDATIKGHTATHLLHQALRDVLGDHVYQTGSNITSERIRFDFSYDKKPTEEEIKKVKEIVNQKIKEDLPVHFEIMSVVQAKKAGAIGLFDEKYGDTVKVYFIGGDPTSCSGRPYSVEFCGGPHVARTGELTEFKIIKEEGLGKNNRRLYCIVE